ncbi:CLC_0170 family protein [Bacillus tuaregi]|uniref:CLC_0170 family protein n=1 Tax=Bacillus tuaregi TaxID=1816695 RepID=UPI0008F8095E|nr:CLC_0170 family protein [Bacillus tuaregi]
MMLGFLGYAVLVFEVTGFLLLLEDVRAYKNAQLKKEKTTAILLGWTNISLGFLIFLSNWIYQQVSW